jgi:hypothetical protein
MMFIENIDLSDLRPIGPRMALPDLFVVGAPKAGTTALHAALAGHPELFMSPVKEPKFFLCDHGPPAKQRGPGDNHSLREWVWRRDRYEALFDAAPPGALKGESTPFYLWSRDAQRRIAWHVPRARFVAIVRDPVDRAYSNWTHLWSDGLEPVRDFVEACELEAERARAGWAPFWRYRELGRYGEQIAHLRTLFPPEQVHVLRYRDVVDDPPATLARIAEFLGIDPDGFPARRVPSENVSRWVDPTPANQALQRCVRTGAWLGQFAPPGVWRSASRPLLKALRGRRIDRPELTAEERSIVRGPLVDDITLLGRLTGIEVGDWLGQSGRGAHSVRRS